MRNPLVSLALLALLALSTGCGAGYVATSSYYQMELLCARVDNQEALRSGQLTPQQSGAVRQVPKIKAFGRSIGLAGSRNYDTVALGWERQIWNVSGSDPLSFTPHTWWFPIVGRVPYLGFFVEGSARQQEQALLQEGLDAYVRTAATYSTLGWFEDPLLLPMLDWPEALLANVLLHELTHATIWAPGGVNFNESLANFVGDVASFAYLAHQYGVEHPTWQEAWLQAGDRATWRELLLTLYQDLDAVYQDQALTDPQKLQQKQRLLEDLPRRVQAARFHEAELYQQAAAEGVWNNARLMQYRTYNDNRRWFAAILDREGGDLRRFIQAVAALADDNEDPNLALQKAAQAWLDHSGQANPPEPRERVLRRLGLWRHARPLPLPTPQSAPPPALPSAPPR